MDAGADQNQAVSVLYDRYAAILFRISYAELLSREDAEDAVQEVFFKYMDKTPSFQDVEHEKAWFIRVTINQCRDFWRRKKLRRYTPLEEVVHLPAKEQENSMLELILTLPEKYKTPILLHYLEGFRVEEVSHILHLTQSAVKMRLSRGRDLLEKKRREVASYGE